MAASNSIRIELTPRQAFAAGLGAGLRVTRWLIQVVFVNYLRAWILTLVAGLVVAVSAEVFLNATAPHIRLATWMAESAARICQMGGECDFRRLQVAMATGMFFAVGLCVLVLSTMSAWFADSDSGDALEPPTAALFMSHYLLLDEGSREKLLDLVQRVPDDVDLPELVHMLRERGASLPVENWPRQ